MEKDRQFIMVMGPGALVVREFSDFYNDDRVIVLDNPMKPLNSKIIRAVRRIHLSNKINDIVDLPFKSIWKSSLDMINWEKDKEYFVIFQSMPRVDPKQLIKYRNEYNIHYIIYEVDVRQMHSKHGIEYWNNAIGFEYIFTFDPAHARKYGLIYSDTLYSMLIDNKPEATEYDLYCATSNKGRITFLLDVFEKLLESGISCKYRITDVKKHEQKYEDKIIYNHKISYDDVVREMKKCNCILEILAPGQQGASLRYYEAVCYNKKLLTNNKNVVNLPFYNPEYMKVFETVDDIDINWIRNGGSVNYGYDGRFSPTHLIDKIIELEENKEEMG